MKRKVAIITSSILGLFLISYVSIWYILSNNIASSLIYLNNAQDNTIFHGNKIVIKDVSVSGFPFKIGAKASSIEEETKEGIIYHKGFLHLGYDILSQKLYFCYDGSIDSVKKNTQNLTLECKSEIYTTMKLSLGLFKILLEKERIFELMNFIKDIEDYTMIKAYNTDDKSLLLDQMINLQISTDNQNYYHNIDELMNDDAKHKYHIKSNIIVSKNDIAGYKIPQSIFYSSLRELSLNQIDFDCTIFTSFKNRINDSEIQVNKFKYDSASYSGDTSCYAKIYINKENVDINVMLKDSTKPKEGFYDSINKSLFVDTISSLISKGVPALLAPIISDISSNPEKYYFLKSDLKSIDTKLDISFLSKDDHINVNIKQFDIFFDESGIKLAHKIVVNPKLAFATNGILSIKHSDNILEYWYGYLSKHFAQDNERISLVKNTLNKFLRAISNHPESTNDEMLFDLAFDSITQDVKIGNKASDELFAIYKKYLYQNALDMASYDHDFMQKATIIVPEFMEDKDILQKLQKASSKAPKLAPNADSNIPAKDSTKK